MLSIADVEKEIAKENAEKQKIREEAKKKVAVAKAEASKKADATKKTSTDEMEKKTQQAIEKLGEKKKEAQKFLSEIKNIDGKIENLTSVKKLSEQAQKELKKLENLRSLNFKKWSNEVLGAKGIEKTLSVIAQGNIADTIHQLSKDLLSKRLEEDMQKELDKLKAAGKIAEEKFLQMKAVIRGHKTVDITQAPVITNAVSQIDKYLKDYVDKQSKDILKKLDIDGNAKKLTNSLDSALAKEKKVYEGLKKISGKLKTLEGLSQEDAALAITKSLNENLNKYTNIDKFFKNIDSNILKSTGSAIDSKKLLGPVLGKINTNVGAKISAQLQPLIKDHVKTIEKITTKIAKLQAQVVAAEKAFKEAVQKYQDMAKNFIQEQTKELANKISQELGINLAGALGGIKLSF